MFHFATKDFEWAFITEKSTGMLIIYCWFRRFNFHASRVGTDKLEIFIDSESMNLKIWDIFSGIDNHLAQQYDDGTKSHFC